MKSSKCRSGRRSVAIFPDAAVGVDVVGLGALALDAGAIHLPDAAHLVVRVAPAAQARFETVFELLAHKVEDDGVDAGVDCCKVDAEVIQDQQEIQEFTALCVILMINSPLEDPAQVHWKPAQSKYKDEAEYSFGHLSSLF